MGGLSESPLRGSEIERERNEALLRSVVEIALDPPPLLVSRCDDSAAGLLDLRQLRVHLRVQPGVLQRHPGSGAGGLNELRLLAQARIVDERREWRTLVVQSGNCALPPIDRK